MEVVSIASIVIVIAIALGILLAVGILGLGIIGLIAFIIAKSKK